MSHEVGGSLLQRKREPARSPEGPLLQGTAKVTPILRSCSHTHIRGGERAVPATYSWLSGCLLLSSLQSPPALAPPPHPHTLSSPGCQSKLLETCTYSYEFLIKILSSFAIAFRIKVQIP